MRNMKIKVENNLDEIVVELERLGYVRLQKYFKGTRIVATDDNGEFYFFDDDFLLEDLTPTTLAELKGMNKC